MNELPCLTISSHPSHLLCWIFKTASLRSSHKYIKKHEDYIYGVSQTKSRKDVLFSNYQEIPEYLEFGMHIQFDHFLEKGRIFLRVCNKGKTQSCFQKILKSIFSTFGQFWHSLFVITKDSFYY